MKKKELYSAIGFIKISTTRQKILKCLEDNYMLPSEIASKTDLGTTQVSNALSDLKNKKLVECINEEDKKGRIYEVTKLGKEVLTHLKNDKIII
ncbi:winged helix-turn-helix domain-containing protein [uncultured Methanobrevibacter sp.]|mgnify:CR=1 FL=1|uniref:winged helix-turn-helix domain-containing protein n=1 Tax=uncultured Methanobrevibacter sp. TaxID=253161 RepID=UPI00263326A3|nr:winged helix-turn-helix domain-containing protein [uncultured Methanobrevibacter sp.]